GFCAADGASVGAGRVCPRADVPYGATQSGVAAASVAARRPYRRMARRLMVDMRPLSCVSPPRARKTHEHSKRKDGTHARAALHIKANTAGALIVPGGDFF